MAKKSKPENPRRMTKEDYRTKVCEIVRDRLKNKPWFRGVNMDEVNEAYREGKSVEETASYVECNTMYWDAPNHGFEESDNDEE